MPPLSESSKEQREEDEESGFGDLPDLDLQLGPHKEDVVGSRAEPPAPRPTPPTQPESSVQETEDYDVTHKLETDLRLSEDEAERLPSIEEHPRLPLANSPLSPQDYNTPLLPSSQLQTETELSFELAPHSPRPDPHTPSAAIEEMRFEPADDWSNPPEIIEISGSQTVCTDSDSADSSSSSGTYDTKLEVGLIPLMYLLLV